MRYYSLSHFLRQRFGCVYKIPVDAGFTCPNRDGTISAEGCAFCWNPSFSKAVGSYSPEDSIRSLHHQIEAGKEMRKKPVIEKINILFIFSLIPIRMLH